MPPPARFTISYAATTPSYACCLGATEPTHDSSLIEASVLTGHWSKRRADLITNKLARLVKNVACR
jgi:hypothetical protein